MQTQFNFEVHQTENNPASQQHLDENRTHFNKQMFKTYNILMSDEVLTVESAVTKHKIMSLPRRIKDLKKVGVLVSDLWDKSVKPPVKRWFFSKEDKEANVLKFPHIHTINQ